MTDRTQPLIAIDVVPVWFDENTLELLYGTAERQFDPYQGEQALPGVLLGAGEALADAARRALTTKAGIGTADIRHLAQIAAFDGPGRDPRDDAISIAFLAVVKPYASPRTGPNSWRAKPNLPFDHNRIIAAAKDTVRTRLWTDQDLTRALTGDTFSTRAASILVAQAVGKRPDAGNLNRQLRTTVGLTSTGKAPNLPKTGGRPATTWAWEQ